MYLAVKAAFPNYQDRARLVAIVVWRHTIQRYSDQQLTRLRHVAEHAKDLLSFVTDLILVEANDDLVMGNRLSRDILGDLKRYEMVSDAVAEGLRAVGCDPTMKIGPLSMEEIESSIQSMDSAKLSIAYQNVLRAGKGETK
jgi:hypothetical protein